jgi:hypothetical protein
MTSIALRAVDGTTVHGWLATIGACRSLAARWPALTLRWDETTPVLDGGPATTAEAAAVITEQTVGRIAAAAVLPDCAPTWPPVGRGWWGTPRTAGNDPWPTSGTTTLWVAAMTTPSGMHLHPLIRPHAAQTVRGMITKIVDTLRGDPKLLGRALTGLGLTPAYPGGLWLLRHESDAGSAASPGRDWLAMMALPWMAALDHDPCITATATPERLQSCAQGWRYRRVGVRDVTELVYEWRLWRQPVPISAIPALITSPWMAPDPTLRCGARREPKPANDPYRPPYLSAFTRRQIAGGALDDRSDRMLTVVQAAQVAGVTATTWRNNVARGRAPAPDERGTGGTWWWRSTVRKWRAGQGAGRRPEEAG